MLLIHVQRELWNNDIAIHLAERKQNALFVAQSVSFTEQSEHCIQEPFLRLRTTEAQLLMDELWNCGIRPSEGTGSAGSLAATERHLKDMQAITKGLLRSEGIEV